MRKKYKKQSTFTNIVVSLGVLLCAFLMCGGLITQVIEGENAKHTPTRTPYIAVVASPTWHTIENIIPPVYPTQHLYTIQTQVSTLTGATALCRDGTYSYSATRSGTCSYHGGVQKWLK
jgi:Protein of unknown function (DUF3761)